MNDVSKSLMTLNDAYYSSVEKHHIIDRDKYRSYPDFSDEYLSTEEQIKEYKKLIIQSEDISSIFFFLNGIKNLDNISIDCDMTRSISIEIIKDKLKSLTQDKLADMIGVSQNIIHKASTKSFITDESAIKVIFTFNKNILKEIIK